MPSSHRRFFATRFIPATLLSLLNVAEAGEFAEQSSNPVALHPTLQDLDLIHEVLTVIAKTRTFDEVIAALEEHPLRLRRVEIEDWGAAYQVQGSVVSQLMISRGRVEPFERKFFSLRVVAVQAIFRPSRVRLSDLETRFGAWYRDPPDGDKVSLASAYFNAKLIHPNASYFLLATTGAGYEEVLSKSEYAETLAATWSDDRYLSTGRPW